MAKDKKEDQIRRELEKAAEYIKQGDMEKAARSFEKAKVLKKGKSLDAIIRDALMVAPLATPEMLQAARVAPVKKEQFPPPPPEAVARARQQAAEPPAAGMGTGAKVGIGVGAVALVGLTTWVVTRK